MRDRNKLQSELERGHVASHLYEQIEPILEGIELELTQLLKGEQDRDKRDEHWRDLQSLNRVRRYFAREIQAGRLAQVEVEKHG